MPTDHLLPNQRMRPGVKALIVHQQKILMVHERIKSEGGDYELVDFPGGGIDFGEGLEAALVREVNEEVGLEIIPQKVIGAWDFVVSKVEKLVQDNRGVHVVCIAYQCQLAGSPNGFPAIDVTHNPAAEDIYDAKWYSQAEILANNGKMLISPGMITAVQNLVI